MGSSPVGVTRKRERLFGRSLFLCLRLEPIAAEGGVERVRASNNIKPTKRARRKKRRARNIGYVTSASGSLFSPLCFNACRSSSNKILQARFCLSLEKSPQKRNENRCKTENSGSLRLPQLRTAIAPDKRNSKQPLPIRIARAKVGTKNPTQDGT